MPGDPVISNCPSVTLLTVNTKLLSGGLSGSLAKTIDGVIRVVVPSVIVVVPSTKTGASATGLTFMVKVRAIGSVSIPPLAVPPLSITRNPKLA